LAVHARTSFDQSCPESSTARNLPDPSTVVCAVAEPLRVPRR
jgi:hypothetical protein